MTKTWRYIFLAIFHLLLCLQGCRSPAEKFHHHAASLRLQSDVIQGKGFQHVIYWRDGGPNRTLHVYLGGDGTPIRNGTPTKDPTPRNPLMLRLLSLDPGPAVHIGRPCYHGLAESDKCSSQLWTTARYSEPIVTSLAGAIQHIMTEDGYDQLLLFGYSGGGALAMLVAERFPEVKAVVTIAANLDIDAWTDHHEFSRLESSLNPVTRPLLSSNVNQHHYAGEHDAVVPPTLVQKASAHLGGETVIIDDFDHVCCWEEKWAQILEEVTRLE